MNRDSADGIVGRQVEAMLRMVRRKQVDATSELLDQAHERARQRVRMARHEARRRVHEAVQELRGGVDARLTRLRASEQAHERARRLEKARQVLTEGRQLLRDQLIERWQDVDTRHDWCDALLGRAAEVLPPGRWEIAYPSAWSESEREAFAKSVSAVAGEEPAFTADDEITAGLRIALGGASLDGTADGLLGRGDDLEARLLATFYAVRDEQGEQP